MLEKDLKKLAAAACLHEEGIQQLATSLGQIGAMMQDAGAWADSLDTDDAMTPGFGVTVCPDGFGETMVLRRDEVVAFRADTLSSSERLTDNDESLVNDNARYVTVPKVVGGKE